jgi:hypothetical protein
MINHPLSQRLALDVLRHHIEMAPLTRVRQSLEDMGAVQTPRDPLLHHEAPQMVGIMPQIG